MRRQPASTQTQGDAVLTFEESVNDRIEVNFAGCVSHLGGCGGCGGIGLKRNLLLDRRVDALEYTSVEYPFRAGIASRSRIAQIASSRDDEMASEPSLVSP
jgi:hypothetical protein